MDVWMPGLRHDPGTGAGYAVGRNRMEMVKQHFTAGTDSYNIVKNGVPGAPSTLAQILLPKVGEPWQFMEIDGLAYDSAEFNDDGPGVEVERLGIGYFNGYLQDAEPLTPDQRFWLGRIIAWLHDEWGVPIALYDGPRFATAGWRGHVNHADLSDQRSDGLTRAEWSAVTAPIPTPIPKEEDMAKLVTSDPNQGSDTILYTGMGWRQVVPGEDQQLFDLGFIPSKSPVVIDPATMTRIRKTLPEVKA